jgi:hypothetical protein
MLLNILFSIFYFLQFKIDASFITKVDLEQNIIEYNYLTNHSSFNSINDVFSLPSLKKYELVSFVSSLNKLSHLPINFYTVIIKYRVKSDTFFKELITILYEEDDPIDTYFTSVNDQLHDFSEYCQSYCLDVMHSSKKYGVFSKGFFKAGDLPKDLPKVKDNNILLNTNAVKGTAFFFASLSAFVSGDLVAPVSVLLSDNDKPFSKTVDLDLDPDILFDYSKVYCINSFSLLFAFESNKQRDDKQRDDKQQSLTIVGDKIPYEYFLKFLTEMQYNIGNELSPSIGLDKDVNKDLIKDNLSQQLEALKLVIIKLEQLIVFEIYDKLTNLIGNDLPLPKIQNYLSKKVSELVILKQSLVKDFPILKADVSELDRLNAVKRELEHIKHANYLSSMSATSHQHVAENVLLDELRNNEFTTWATLHVYSPLKRCVTMITRAVIAVPEGVAVGGLQGIYDFLLTIFQIFSFNPVTTCVITIVGLSLIYASVSTVVIIIYNFVYTFVSWVFWPFSKGTKVPL